MRRAQLVGIVLVQVVLLIAALISTLAVSDITTVFVVSLIVIAAVVVLIHRAHEWILILSCYLAVGFYYVVAVNPSEPLFGALIPLTAWSIVLPIMLQPGIWPILLSGLLTGIYPVLIVIAHPEWDRSVPATSLITNAILVANAAVFIAFLRRIAGFFDRQNKAAIEEQERAVRQQASKEATAEYVRVLHDTIVNTFGALSREGSHGISVNDVKERCRRDLGRIHNFQRSTATGRRVRLSLTDLDYVGLTVRWTGMSGDDLRRFQALLPVPVLDALYGCAAEAVLNATKHSGAGHVVVNVQYVDDKLQFAISDEGCGFDTAAIEKRGIAESLFARGDAQGITVALDSTVGEGTTVWLSFPLGAPIEAADVGRAIRPLGRFTRAMAIAWALHAIAIGVSLEAFSPLGDSLPAYLLLATLLVFAGASAIASRNDRRFPVWLIVLMFIAVPAMNWCALASVSHGDYAPYLFQAVSLTVLPVLIRASNRTFTPFLVAAAVQIVSLLIIGLGMNGPDPNRIAEVILLEAPTAVLLTMWFALLRKFRSIDTEIAESRTKMERAIRDAAAYDAAAEVQLQWSTSGLQGSLELLRDIADGVISHDDPETRRRCGDEEAFLRQISALSQAATIMSRWFALALAEARRRQIQLELHAEHVQVDDAQAAVALGHLLLDCIATGAENSALIVTLLQRDDTVRMLIVGSWDNDLAAHAHAHRERLRITLEQFQDQVVLDATVSSASAAAYRPA